ncbi:MAG TPA: flagellar basal body-associated FliL family protein [Methylomirabilota bacterium]|nr:flagellar basal body-associated FliL family protein [Methylomirabilota bacterium]
MAKQPTADKSEDGADAATDEGKKGLLANKKLLIGAGAGLVLLAGGGVGAMMMLGGEETGPTSVAASAEAPLVAYYYDLPVMIVNLSAVDNRTAYVKLEVALELSEKGMVDILQPNLPRVLDAFQTYLRELRPSDLSGSAGLFRLKEELQRRVNIAVYPARVDDVLFKNVIVQ